MNQGHNVTQGQGMPGQAGAAQRQGMPGQNMTGQYIAAQSMMGASQPYPSQNSGMQGQGQQAQPPNFNQNAAGNYGGGYQQHPQQAGGQTGSYPSTQSQNPYNTPNPSQPNYNQNNSQNFAQTGQQNIQSPQGYSYGVPPAGQPNQNVPPQTGYQQTRTDSFPSQPAGGYPFPANGQPGGNGSPVPQHDSRNITGQSFANNNTGSHTNVPPQPHGNPAEWTQEFSRPYPQRPPQAASGNPPAMPGSMTGGGNNARQGADMNMMASGMGWIPPDQLGQLQQPQPNPFAQLNQSQDGTGARPVAGGGPMPAPDQKNRPPAKEEKLV
jgi:hypothetical protein